MAMARRPSGDWATPARLDALPWSRPSPLSILSNLLSSPPLAEGDYFLTVWASFPRRTGRIRVMRAWSGAESESHGPHVGAGG